MKWIKTIKTRFGETYENVVDITIIEINDHSIKCYVVQFTHDVTKAKLYRYIPMRDVVEIMDVDCNTYNLKE